MTLLQEGQMVRGTYEVDRFLGEGAFAEVFRVKHRFLGRQAMKVFRTVGMTLAETEEVLGEAIMLSSIGHPNIVRVFDANTAETPKGAYGFFTMEYVAGGSLDQFWKSHGSRFVPVATTVEIMSQVCQGLTVAHSETPPIIHRDIKPQNILVGYDAGGLRARVSDFGLAKRANPLTLMASAKGTLSFKAPETFLDPLSDSCAGDVWALGSTAYLLLTDRLPYQDVGEHDRLVGASFKRPLIPPSRLNLDVDGALDQIVLRALALDPAQRYATAGQLLDDLALWRQGERDTAGEPKLAPSASVTMKSALGVRSAVDEQEAQRMAKEAIVLARQAGTLPEAADRMEEAFNKWPDLRPLYEHRVKLWRNGVVM